MIRFTLVAITALIFSATAETSPEVTVKIEAQLTKLKVLGSDPTIVAIVKKYNIEPSAEAQAMTQDKWKELSVLSPEVKAFTKNELVTYLKSKTKDDEAISELFISGDNGCKVGCYGKPSNWSHKGKPKHDLPMAGKTWIGQIEVDESTGVQQVQVSFPVLDGKSAIGSIVVGMSIAKLK